MTTTPSPTWYENATTISSTMDNLHEEEENDEGFKGLVQVFRVFKLARILKLARYHLIIITSSLSLEYSA